MPTWITLYWTKEVGAVRTDEIRFFSKDGAQYEPCKTMDVKVMLLVLLVFRGYEISRTKFL
jgi:hypothetical protein